jgi:hypothetical protein
MKFHEYLAHMIVRRRTHRRFSTLHADFLEQQMTTPTSNVNANTDSLKRGNGGTQADAQKIKSDASGNTYTVPSVVTVSVKQTDYKTLEGSFPGDHRPQASDVTMPPQPAPRGETADTENAGA